MKYWKHFLVGAVIIMLVCLAYDACNARREAVELKQRYDALKYNTDKYKKVAEKTIADKSKEIGLLNNKINELNSNVEEKYNEISAKDERLLELEKTAETLGSQAEIIANLQEQVRIWRDKFSLAEKIIADKDKIIFSLNQKYESQLKITDSYKGLYKNEQQLHELAIERLRVANKRLHTSIFSGRIKNVVLLGLGGLIAYGLVR